MNKWLLLTYKIPREPSALRVSIWRKLKQLGALLLHDSVWVLPATTRTREQFQWLASEITELGGEATLWAAETIAERQHQMLVKQFSVQADDAYKAILVELRRKRADLSALGRKYQQVLAQDFFQSKYGQKVRATLLAKGEKKP